MNKNILLIACFLVFLGFSDGESPSEENDVQPKEDPEMQILVDHISELASKVLEIFEPMAAKASNESYESPENTYFVSFLLRDRKNRTAKQDLKQRMIVNNNFSGEKMGNHQVYVESGPPPKQSPAHNVQLVSSPTIPSQGYEPQNYQHPYQPQQPQQHQNGMNGLIYG